MTPLQGKERREFTRLDYVAPLAFKVCKEETLNRLFQGYTVNISEAGILCQINEQVNIGDVLWLSFDRGVLSICEEIEKRSFIYQSGIIGKVLRVENSETGSYNIGIKFFMREENVLQNVRI